jgi:hypothetical protein
VLQTYQTSKGAHNELSGAIQAKTVQGRTRREGRLPAAGRPPQRCLTCSFRYAMTVWKMS